MKYEERIHEDLKKYLKSLDKVDELLPQCPDVEDLWKEVGKAYIPDGIREFQQYPVVSLGWMMFIGMALAYYWDKDWEKYSKFNGAELYEQLRDAKGYDGLDDHILEDVLKLDKEDAEKLSSTVGECASRVHHALITAGFEPGTKEAAQAYIASLRQMYIMGMAMELRRLGYHMSPLQ